MAVGCCRQDRRAKSGSRTQTGVRFVLALPRASEVGVDVIAFALIGALSKLMWGRDIIDKIGLLYFKSQDILVVYAGVPPLEAEVLAAMKQQGLI